MSKASIKKNYILNTAYQVFNLLVPLITTPYVSRVLEADGIGANSFVAAISGYFCLLAALGIQAYGQREISYHQNDRKRRTSLFWEIESIAITSTLLSLIVYYLFVIFQNSNRIIFVLYGIQIITVMFDITWLYTGMEDFEAPIKRSFLVKVLSIIGIFILVNNKEDLWIYVLLYLGLGLLGNVLMCMSMRKYVDIEIRFYNPKKHIKAIIGLFIPTIAIQVYLSMDKIMIGYLTTDSYQNGYYEQSQKLIRLILTVVTSLSVVMIPRISHLLSENRIDEMNSLIYKSFNFVMFIGYPCCLGIISAIDTIIPWFFGKGYDDVSGITKILAPQILFIGMSNITAYQCLVPRKLERIFTITVIFGVLINFVGNILLIPKYGAIGAALASTVTECVVMVSELIYLRNKIDVFKILKMSINYALCSCVMYFVIIGVNNYITSGVLGTFLVVAMGAVVYFVCLFVLKDSFFMNTVLKSAKKFIKKEKNM